MAVIDKYNAGKPRRSRPSVLSPSKHLTATALIMPRQISGAVKCLTIGSAGVLVGITCALQSHLVASARCPRRSCWRRFASRADDATSANIGSLKYCLYRIGIVKSHRSTIFGQ